MRLLAIAVLVLAALAAAPAFAQPLPDALRSAGVTQAQWDVVRAEARVQAERARISEASLLAAAEAASVNLAASGRFDPFALQQAIFEALAEQAERIADLQRRLEVLTGDPDPSIAAMFAQARAALEAGRLAEADRLLAQVAEGDLAAIQRADAEAERRRLRAGATIASRGQVAFVQADYLGAAAHYARAAETVPQADIESRWLFTVWRGRSLFEHSQLMVEPSSLQQAIAAYDAALAMRSREQAPFDWALVQTSLGMALRLQGERGAPGALEQAVAALEAALTILTRESDPVGWAETQIGLGNALMRLGERGVRGALERAVGAYEAALTVQSRTADPATWALAHMNLGIALTVLGDRGAPGALERAVAAYDAALTVWTREAHPSGWAQIQTNLGSTLLRQAQRGAPGALERAVTAYEAALTVRTRELDPAGWAMIQISLGNALRVQGERGGPGALLRAVAALEAALTVMTREADLGGWARIQGNLALTYAALGRIAEARDAMQRAEAAFAQIGDSASVVQARNFIAQLPAQGGR